MASSLETLRDRIFGRAIVTLARLSPRGAERALDRYLDCVPRSKLLAGALKRSAIESITVRGKQGLFQGSTTDASVIRRYALDAEWATATTQAVVEFFGPSRSGTYVDVGGNIGLTVVPIAANGINVIAFEPSPRNFGYLQQNIAANGVSSRVTAENVALMDSAGEVVLELSPNNFGDNRVRRGGGGSAMMQESQWTTVAVPARRLDEYASQIKRPVALKMDTQGAEPFVVAGGQQVCAMADLVICEFWPYNMNRMKANPTVVAEYLAGFSSVTIYEGESDDVIAVLPGSELPEYLRKYEEQYREIPFGRYLNLLARR